MNSSMTGNTFDGDQGPHDDFSANFGEEYVVQIEYSTDEQGIEVADNFPKPPFTLHGPFITEDKAQEWMDERPDDEDVTDMFILVLNKVRP